MSVSKLKAKHEFVDPSKQGPLFSVRFLIALLLIAAGIAWVVIWNLYVRDLRQFEFDGNGGEPGTLIPGIKKLKDWNWLVGFGLLFLGLAFAAHPKTPLGRGKGVIVGMLGCFLIGLLWICTFYVFADRAPDADNAVWLINDLGQLNLMVGIGFMAVGFTYATKWE
jgi:hypothetical protein